MSKSRSQVRVKSVSQSDEDRFRRQWLVVLECEHQVRITAVKKPDVSTLHCSACELETNFC